MHIAKDWTAGEVDVRDTFFAIMPSEARTSAGHGRRQGDMQNQHFAGLDERHEDVQLPGALTGARPRFREQARRRELGGERLAPGVLDQDRVWLDVPADGHRYDQGKSDQVFL